MPLQTLPNTLQPINPRHPLARGLCGFWLPIPGLDGGPKLWDLVGNNHGVLSGSVSWATGANGNNRCLNFGSGLTGSVTFTNVVNIPSVNNAITLVMWLQVVPTGSNNAIALLKNSVINAPQYCFFPGTVGVTFTDGNLNNLATPAPTNGVWTQWVFTLDGNNNYTFYLNGVLKQAGTLARPISTTEPVNQMWFGNRNGGSWYEGGMDAPMIYNRVLSAAEVLDLYEMSRLGYPGLVNQSKIASLAGKLYTPQVIVPVSVSRPQQPVLKPYLPKPYNHDHPLARGLVSWWLAMPGLMGGGTWWDLVGGNHGTLTNMANANNGWRSTVRPGGFGQVLCDGTSGFVSVANRPSLNLGSGDFTISLWYCDVKATANDPLLFKGAAPFNTAGVGIGLRTRTTDNHLEFIVGSGVGTQTRLSFGNNPTANVWRQVTIVVSRSGSLSSAYINGVFQASVNWQSTYTDTYNLEIGSSDGGGSLPGSIDDVRIYNRALSATEAYELYQNSRRGCPALLNQPRTTLGVQSQTTKVIQPLGVTRHNRPVLRPFLPRPYNHEHPLALNLQLWLLCVPGWMGGPRWFDLVSTYHGALNNVSGWVSTARPGGFGALSFNGTSSYVQFAPASAGPLNQIGTGDFTISAWVYRAGVTGNDQTWISNRGNSFQGIGIGVHDNGSIETVIANTTYNAGTLLATNQWYHYALTRTSGTIQFYLNGQPTGTTAVASASIANNGASWFGADSFSNSWWSGQIDDVRVYNRSLSQADIFDSYTNSRFGYPRLLNQGSHFPLSSAFARFRKASSALGTRVGKRQIHYKPRGM